MPALTPALWTSRNPLEKDAFHGRRLLAAFGPNRTDTGAVYYTAGYNLSAAGDGTDRCTNPLGTDGRQGADNGSKGFSIYFDALNLFDDGGYFPSARTVIAWISIAVGAHSILKGRRFGVCRSDNRVGGGIWPAWANDLTSLSSRR